MNGHSQHNSHHNIHHIEEHHHIIDRHESTSPQNGYPPQYIHRKNSISHQDSLISNRQDDASPTNQNTSGTKHSLLQFALQHFRNE